MGRKYVLGLDFGTESGRALLVAVDNGEEIATSVVPFRNGVIDTELPSTGKPLPPDWALQDPRDYLHVLRAIVPEVLGQSSVDPADIVGIGTDFTACTLIPIDGAGTPLCTLPDFESNRHAWCKLWKHHAAQAEADECTRLAEERREAFLPRYGGKISSEWLFPKALQVLREAPEIYAATDRFIEAGDWLTLYLTGEEKRNACAAGYKALWDEAYPSPEYLGGLDPAFANIVQEKLGEDVYPAGTRAGALRPEVAEELGLEPGTAVAVSSIDAHVAVPASTVCEPGKMVMIMGTSLCHMANGVEKLSIEGMAGVVKDGIIPGLYGYEAGQPAVGDIFAWFVENCVSAEVAKKAVEQNTDIHGFLSCKAAGLKPGESGVLCLDWWNGNRSVLVDAELSGLMVGMTLSTRPEEMYRAVLESTAFGTRKILETLEAGGCPIDELYACGGLSVNAPFLMQIFADVTNRPIKVAASDQTVALGAAMWGAVAAGKSAGGYDTVQEAAASMARLRDQAYIPDAKAHAIYNRLFAEYERLHDLFGRGADPVMKTLREIKRAVRNPNG